GTAKAEIKAKAIVVIGKVSGNVQGTERVEIQATGVVEGDVSAPRLVVAEGAVLNGSIHMTATPGQKGAQPSHEAHRPLVGEGRRGGGRRAGGGGGGGGAGGGGGGGAPGARRPPPSSRARAPPAPRGGGGGLRLAPRLCGGPAGALSAVAALEPEQRRRGD